MRNTPNYNLPQYEGTDKFTKEVLNDAFAKVDTAINNLQETFNSQAETNIDVKIINEVISARGDKETVKDNIDGIKNDVKSVSDEVKEVVCVINTSSYENDITVTEYKYSNGTSYWITKIPYLNSDGSVNKIKKSFANDVANVIGNEAKFTTGEYIAEHNMRKNATLGVNASAFDSSGRVIGTQIKDGVVYQECETSSTFSKNYVLGITGENKLKVYNYNTPSNTLLSDGVINTFCFMTPIILGGQDVPQNIKDLYPSGYTLLANRQMIAQKKDSNDIYILTSEGRTINDAGLTFQHCTDILLELGMEIAYALDGGGSATTIVNGYMLNTPAESTGEIKERLTFDMLYVEKQDSIGAVDKTILKLERDLLLIKRELFDIKNNSGVLNFLQIHSADTYNSKGIMSYENGVPKKRIILDKSGFKVIDMENNNKVLLSIAPNDDNITTSVGKHGNFLDVPNTITDCNSLKNSGEYWITNTCLNSPLDSSYLLKHIQVNPTSAMQIAYPYSTSLKTKMRRTTGVDEWSAWIEI